jgi:hypothetical protein
VFARFGHKFKHTKHIAVVGYGQGFHAISGSFFVKLAYVGSAVEQRKLGVNM